MNYSEIKYCDIANGVGVRTSLFVSGCRRHCPFCFNEVAWPLDAGEAFSEEVQAELLESLRPAYVDGLTVLGGEPFEVENQRGLVDFLERVKEEFPEKSLWMFSGFTWEELTGEQDVCAPYTQSPVTEVTDRILQLVDVLVDGPFMQDRKDITLRFRGSSNQRIIDVPATRATGRVVMWADDPVFSTHSM